MNRKIKDADRDFILARYRRDPHAFDARTTAREHGVTPKTIYNVISQAGLRMRRGRKPIIPPQSPQAPPDLTPLEPLVCPPLTPLTPSTPLTTGVGPRKGPPIIRPKRPQIK